LKDNRVSMLRTFIKADTMDLHFILSFALELVELIRKQHSKGFLVNNLNPDYISIQLLEEQLVVQLVASQSYEMSNLHSAEWHSNSHNRFLYISPEQTGRMMREKDERSDLYLVGILLYELMTGVAPFRANSANEWIHAHMALLPAPPELIKPEVPQLLSELVMKLLSKTPEQRYQSAYGLLDDLQYCLEQLNETGEIGQFPLGRIDEMSRFRLPDKLYGRDRELQELVDVYNSSRSGSMEFMLIGGHAGSGKTSLVKAMETAVKYNNGYFISGKCDLLQSVVPYGPLIIAFRDLILHTLAGTEQHVASWKKKILDVVGLNGSVLIEVIAELELIIGKQLAVEALPPTESMNRFQMLFNNFIKVFADQGHPLVIWLENLQWADKATIQMLQVLLQDSSNKYLFIIGTYRDNEIDSEVLEELYLNNFSNKHNLIQYMNIKDLTYGVVADYVADVLHLKHDEIKGLVEALYQKTAGNPLYIKQMLQTFYDEQLIFFNCDNKRWEWDLPSIKAREDLQDVMDLIVGRLNALPEKTRQLLSLSSCIGSSFDLNMLSLLCDNEEEQTKLNLLPALSEGLLLVENNTYTFMHDQVQRAVYDLMLDGEKKQVHLKIGRFLLHIYQSYTKDEYLFEVVHHLNLSSELLTDQCEMEQLAQLNLCAGRKAKSAAAYDQALDLLTKGLELISSEGWTRHYELYFSLLLESSECQYFCGYFEQADTALGQLLLEAKHLEDRARVYVIRIAMYAFQKKEHEACDVALIAMREFGLIVPSRVSSVVALSEIGYTRLLLFKNMGRLAGLPMGRDPLHKALADIVMVSSSILYVVNEELAVIVLAKYVRMSLKQGNSEALAIALGSYAISLCFGIKSYKTALRLAEIAVSYSDPINSPLVSGKIQFFVAMLYQFLRPREAIIYIQNAEKLSIECGDMVYAGYIISTRIITEAGDLRRLENLCHHYIDSLFRMLDRMTLDVLNLTLRYVHLLQGKPGTVRPDFNNEQFNENELLNQEILNNTNKSNLYYFFTCKLEVLYLYGYYDEALDIAEQSDKYHAGTVLSFNQRHCFYYALAITALYPVASDSLKSSYRRKLKKLIARMTSWTKIIPENTSAKLLILRAETARLKFQYSTAAMLYDQAIKRAQENAAPHDEAIANELAAKMLVSLGNYQSAEQYILEACKAYSSWGAEGMVRSLQERFPSLLKHSIMQLDNNGQLKSGTEEEIAEAEDRRISHFGKELDMEMLKQASKVVSEDTPEMEFLEVFLQLASHSVGAEKGFVILKKDGEWEVAAEIHSNPNRDFIAEDSGTYSFSVIQFVWRTREAVVLGEACQSIFASDPYIQQKNPKSILCLPIHYPNNREGVLYLENNLASDAFTLERLDILEMVLSRMAYMKLWQLQKNMAEQTGAAQNTVVPSLIEALSNREIQILRLMDNGLSNKEIAVRLEITEGTVKSHAFNIYGKLQVNKRVKAIARARELHILD
jgi:predicted ATPase/DNA-binding CsgD family transcriptional regulator/GAF domain-containing protein